MTYRPMRDIVSLVLGLLAACDGGPVETFEPEPAVTLSGQEHLARAAMALRGTRPSIAELEQVRDDPKALPEIIDTYLVAAEFGATIRDIENQTLLMRIDAKRGDPIPEAAGSVSWNDWSIAMFEEPLRLIEHIVLEDRPYTDIVTTDQTVVTGFGPMMWTGIAPVEHIDASWQVTTHTDGRPTTGILATSAWQARYVATNANAHREAASAAAGSLLCTDYFNRDVQLGEVNLEDDDAIFDAINYNDGCIDCHQTLDPLAGFFFGFSNQGAFRAPYPRVPWTGEDLNRGERITGRPKGYFGLGGTSMDEMGDLIAADHRFSACTARRYISWLSQIPVKEVPIERVASAQTELIDSGMNIRAMVRQIVLSPQFAVSHTLDADEAERTFGLLRTRPEQLDRMFYDLTGFRWRRPVARGTAAIPTHPADGFLVHGGGIDNGIKVVPSHLYSASGSAFLRSFAQEAAGFVVAQDFDVVPEERKLLHLVEPDTDDEILLREQLTFLHQRILIEDVQPDSAVVDDSLELFFALRGAETDATVAWKLLLTAFFQDFRVAYH